LLDFDRDTVAIHQHDAGSHRQIVGEDLDLVGLGGVQFDDGTTGKPHHLVDGHGRGAEHHHEIDSDFIEGRHFETAKRGLNCVASPDHVMVSQWLMTAKALI
jgi:hypothetical protein